MSIEECSIDPEVMVTIERLVFSVWSAARRYKCSKRGQRRMQSNIKRDVQEYGCKHPDFEDAAIDFFALMSVRGSPAL